MLMTHIDHIVDRSDLSLSEYRADAPLRRGKPNPDPQIDSLENACRNSSLGDSNLIASDVFSLATSWSYRERRRLGRRGMIV